MNIKILSFLCLATTLFSLFVFDWPVQAASFSYTATNLQSTACPNGGSYTQMNLTESGDIVTIVGTGFWNRDIADSIPESAYISVDNTTYNVYRGQRVDANNQTIYFGPQSWTDNNITLEVAKGQGNLLGSSIVLRTYNDQNDSQGSCMSATLSSSSPDPVPSTPALCSASDYSCSEWNVCSADESQTRTCSKVSSCEGGVSMPATSQSCTFVPPICSSWNYSDWGVCTDNEQIRTILSSNPTGCTGGSPALTQACSSTPAPALTCTSWTYSDWGVCTESQQTRSILSSSPTGCTGGNPILNQSCTSSPTPASICTSWTYSDWSLCTENQQTRTVLSSSPASCTGGSPALSQTCVSGPQIISLSPSTVYPGLKVTINGKSFGSFGAYGYYCPTCLIQVNDISVTPTYDSKYVYEWSDTGVSFNMPNNAKDGFITLTDKNGVKSNQFAFTLSPDPTAPVINSISPDTITPGETIVTIYGKNFGSSYSSYDNQICFSEYCISSFYLGDYVSQWTDTEIKVRPPSYIGEGSGNISIKAYFQSTKKYDFVKGPSYTVKKTPIITLYYPIMLQGDSFRFSGKNFGETQGKIVLNGIEAAIITWSDTDVTFRVPSEAVSGQIYIESSNGVKSSPIEVDILKKYSDDEYSFYQWYLETLHVDEAWDITQGSSDVVVAVIDSGVDIDHEDLKDAIWKNKNEIANNGIDDDSNGYIDDIYGWDFVLNSNSTGINEGHGTSVASLIAAKKGNGIGIAGIAPGVKIMALNISTIEDGTRVSVDAANKAIKYAVDNGADIINLSFAGFDVTKSHDAALKYAYENNVLVVAAVGNDDANLEYNPYSPACVDLQHNAVIGVASIDIENIKSSFSNYGKSCVDLAAPGEYIIIAVPLVLGNYSIENGTSFSAPLVSGIAALIKSKNPDWNVEEIKKVLLDTADNVDYYNPLYTGEMGMGLPNAYLALKTSRPNVTYNYNPTAELILKDTGLTIKIEEPDLRPIEEPGLIENEQFDEGIIKNENLIQNYFPDIQGNKNEEAINYLKDQGIVKGYPDGTFKPDNTLNRAELLKIVVLAKYPEPNSDFNKNCFTDVEQGAWYAPYICFAKENKIVQGYSNKTFKPSQEINYVEALKITLETMDYSPSETTETWYQAYLDKASAMIIGLDLAPNKNITRGEMAQLIMNVMEY